MAYTVKALADLSGVTPRTLRFYDSEGLLKPSRRTESGIRLYEEEQVQILQQILFFREMDFPLSEIEKLICAPDFDRIKALESHRKMLKQQAERFEKLVKTVDRTIEDLKGGNHMTKEHFEAFDMKAMMNEHKKYEAEAEQRWGETDAYKQSSKRTKSYTEDDWRQIHRESAEIDARLIELMDSNALAEDERVQKCIHDKRMHLNKYFYDCPVAMIGGLGQMYIDDPRFTKNIDKAREGLAAYMRDAMVYYSENHEE